MTDRRVVTDNEIVRVAMVEVHTACVKAIPTLAGRPGLIPLRTLLDATRRYAEALAYKLYLQAKHERKAGK